MYKISIKDSSIDITDSNEVIQFIKNALNKNDSSDSFFKIESKEFTLKIWFLYANSQLVLLFVPQNSDYDYKISCCANTNKINAPAEPLTIENNTVTCSEYNMLDISKGLNAIKNALCTVDLESLGEYWTCY